jgi:glyoxylase-like metal-dependent hydrolase (beta-lactamase superfamily II)
MDPKMIKNIYSVENGNLMLDGGAMFGVVPKVMWNKVYPANEKNQCNISTRSLLVDAGDRKILIDNGVGEKQDEKFAKNYQLNGEATLENSLHEIGIPKDEITDVIMTHLHFDHCGGAVEEDKENGGLKLAFPNADYFCSRSQWNNAMHPNRREAASYLKENLLPMEESGRLKFIEENMDQFPGIQFEIFDGHTVGQVIPFIEFKDKKIVYVSDLIPTSAHVKLPWITAYDIQPLKMLEEKERFLQAAYENQYVLFFEHDIYCECCTLAKGKKGIEVGQQFNLAEVK